MTALLDISKLDVITGIGDSSSGILDKLREAFILDNGEDFYLKFSQIFIVQGVYFHIIKNHFGLEGAFYPFSDLEDYINL